MSNNPEHIFYRHDYDHFKAWICLNLDAVTWQGRYEKEFDDFWDLFFVDGLSFSELIQRFDYAKSHIDAGPVQTWFTWLQEKLLCFVFVKKDFSVKELALQSKLSISYVSTTLRNYFLEQYPFYDESLSELFQTPYYVSEHANLKFSELRVKLDISSDILGSHHEDVMPGMEITLYDDWMNFLRKIRKDFFKTQISLQKIKRKANIKGYLKTARDVVALFVIGGILIWAVQAANHWYKDYLVNKISIYEPQLQWLDRTLTFQPASTDATEGGFDLNPDEIDEIIDESADMFADIDLMQDRFETESEIVVTSWDTLPRDFSVVDLERSEFEEVEAGGYRDTRFGNITVYRVMMTTANAYESRARLNSLLSQYSVEQADNVRPGQFVPGGVYYNLFVPRSGLKEFLTEVTEVDETVIYESRTRSRGRAPAGHSKVFIWVKTI